LSAGTALTAYLARRRPFAFAAAVLAAAAALGLTIATLRSALIAHPVLERPLYGASIAGFIEVREERERTDRIVLKVVSIEADRLDTAPERVRLSVRRGTAPAVGSYVTLEARSVG
jgi:competence protein ComEC